MTVQIEGAHRCQYVDEDVRLVNSLIRKYPTDGGWLLVTGRKTSRNDWCDEKDGGCAR